MNKDQSLLALEVRNKSYPHGPVLSSVGLCVQSGEIVSLVGPSGCGKSTLLRLIAGLDTAYDGWIQVAGQPVSRASRTVGFIFQEPRLLPWLTVADNVGFAAGRGGGGHPRVVELLEEVGLAAFASAYPKQLSGGMAQRAAIARGLFTQPALLLLDEPFSAVDAFTRMRLQDLLLAVARQHRTTLLLVTHDIDEALYLSDRVLIMSAHPGTIRSKVAVRLPYPRDRREPLLAALKTEVLSQMYEGLGDLTAADPARNAA